MKRFHCWSSGEDASDGRGFDADTPGHAAEAYVEVCCTRGAPKVIHVRLPGQAPVRVRVTVEMVPKYTGEVLE